MIITPAQFGLPDRYQVWRPGQYEAVEWVLGRGERFTALCAPTGYGKSLAYMAMAILGGKRTVVLTSTKGLQDQLNSDFAQISTDIRGMQNYGCDAAVQFGFPASTRVADAPCLSGAKCSLRSGGCGYFDQLRRAQQASIIVTNYQCWMHSSQLHTDENPVEMLIGDEIHDASDALSSYLATELERKECLSLGVTWPISGYSQGEWSDWAHYWRDTLETRREELEGRLRSEGVGPGFSVMHEIRESKKLERKLDRVSGMKDDWVIEEVEPHGDTMKGVKFDPLWPRHYRETLFKNIPKVVLVSATVRPKTAELLGIGGNELAFAEYESSFPVEHRPVIHVPTVRMNYHNERNDDTMMWWLRKIDLLVGARLDRKGVIHTVSYKRARFILDNSVHADRMLIHGSDNRAHVIARFKQSGAGTVLLSPSVDTGYDFAGELAEYQIIVKLPFPDTRGAVMKARCQEDKEYSAYLTAQILQQMTGRVCRSETDRGETLVVDDNIGWFTYKYRHYLNEWWRESYRVRKNRLPEPLDKL
jgi:Rad3-related DNA helicase